MSINIDPEQIEKYIAEQILKSSLGESVKNTIDEFIHAKSNSWDKKTIFQLAIEKEVKRQVLLILKDLIADKKDTIKAKLQDQMTDKMVEDVASKCLSMLISLSNND